jgi:hypothetical protein
MVLEMTIVLTLFIFLNVYIIYLASYDSGYKPNFVMLFNFVFDDPTSLKNFKTYIKNVALDKVASEKTGDEKVNIQVKFDEESEEALSSGKEIIKQDGGSNELEENDKETDISLTKDVLPFIIPLICILTINTEHKDILEMLNVIKSNPSLLSVFEDQSFIWWNKPDIIKLIEVIIDKYIKKDSCIYNISILFKMSLQSLIDHPKELFYNSLFSISSSYLSF